MTNSFKKEVNNYDLIDHSYSKNVIVTDHIYQKKVIFTIGVSASGKSTWANDFLSSKDCTIIERDKIRQFIFTNSFNKPFTWKDWNWNLEPQINTIQQMLIGNAIKSNSIDTIIISDTNVRAKTINDIIECCEQHDTEINYYYKLFDINVNEAIERDSKRVHSVGKEVIEKQFNMLNQLTKNYKITT